MPDYKYLNLFPASLKDSIIQNRCLPIIGSGFSLNAKIPVGKKMLAWEDLGRAFANEMTDYVYSNAIDAISAYEYAYSRLAPEDHMFGDEEFILLNSPELVKEIRKLIKENKEELRKISRDISNPTICDGAVETFRFGRMKFEGSNILTVSMEGYKENLKKY